MGKMWDDTPKYKFELTAREEREKDFACSLKNSYRLLCDSVVIAYSPGRLGKDFGMRTLQMFKGHLFNALTDPNFVFDGVGPKMNGKEYIKFHQDRLGIKITTNFEIVPPSEEFFMLAPKRDNIH